jgi:hypothetical protein
MSRLDDELRIAFKREQPSMDFAARVLERINETPAPKRSWWRRLSELFEPPKLRWIAVGVAASLIVAIGVAQYQRLQNQRLQKAAIEEGARMAQTDPASEPGDADTKNDDTKNADAKKADAGKDESVAAADTVAAPDSIAKIEQRRTVAPSRHRINRGDAARAQASNRDRLAAAPKEKPVSAEAEAAKERVIFALQIVGSTLGDAQRVIQEDYQKSKPEPLHNR